MISNPSLCLYLTCRLHRSECQRRMTFLFSPLPALLDVKFGYDDYHQLIRISSYKRLSKMKLPLLASPLIYLWMQCW